MLRAGALPMPIKVVEERSVSASLGADSIRQGRNAFLIGIVGVVDTPVRNLDVAPTLLDVLGLPIPSAMRGEDDPSGGTLLPYTSNRTLPRAACSSFSSAVSSP